MPSRHAPTHSCDANMRLGPVTARRRHRNFYVAINIDEDTPLMPSGQVRFPLVPGAPAEGIVCNVPPQWGARCKQLVFPLKS